MAFMTEVMNLCKDLLTPASHYDISTPFLLAKPFLIAYFLRISNVYRLCNSDSPNEILLMQLSDRSSCDNNGTNNKILFG